MSVWGKCLPCDQCKHIVFDLSTHDWIHAPRSGWLCVDCTTESKNDNLKEGGNSKDTKNNNVNGVVVLSPLPVLFEIDNHNSRRCTICLDETLLQPYESTTLPCLHIFHTSCIDTWLYRHETCPLCRRTCA
jgi:hypothetical protein